VSPEALPYNEVSQSTITLSNFVATRNKGYKAFWGKMGNGLPVNGVCAQ